MRFCAKQNFMRFCVIIFETIKRICCIKIMSISRPFTMRKLYIFTLFLLLPIIGYSHPHVIVTYDVSFLLNENGVYGIKMNWDMDEMFSASLIDSFDENRDKKFDAAEVKVIQQEAFSNLENYHYMTYVHLDNKPNKFFPAKDFHATIKDGIVKYTFTLPVDIKAEDKEKTLAVSVYDESYFMALNFKDSVTIEAAKNTAFSHSSNIKKNTVKTVYDTDEARNIAQLTIKK
ncbi:MAG: DUF1007 family protein [Gammaproteobacteria bacterium]|nr:MAG: DUF1007 family protein [Gammaproteobacteria bacterium]